MTPLILALLGTVALLLGLWILVRGGWWLVLRLVDPLLEGSRASIQKDRILRHHQVLEQHRLALAQERARQRRQVIDVDGQVRWLLPEEVQSFHRRCWAELGLAEGSPWPVVRQHWRRSSLRWHPDHGGDPAVWLRKQRAYEALNKARGQSSRFGPGQAPPQQLSGRRRPWPWRRKPPGAAGQ